MTINRARRQELRQLGQKKHRRSTGLFLVEGLRLIEEAAEAGAEFTEVLYTSGARERAGGERLLQLLRSRRAVLTEVGEKDIAALADTVTAQGIVGVVRMKHTAAERLLSPPEESSLLVALDALADPGNVGTILRTCDWFNVHGVILGRSSVELLNPKLVRGTMGSLFRVRIAQEVDLTAFLLAAKEHAYSVVVADARGESRYDRVAFPRRCILVLGNEAHGVSSDLLKLADLTVAVPRYGHVESLNVAITCGILLAAYRSFGDQ